MKTPRKEYNEFYTTWQKNRDCVAGQEAVKGGKDYKFQEFESGGTYKFDVKTLGYLPPLSGQITKGGDLDSRYWTYLQYALWYGATGRTVEGLVGLVFRKDPVVKFPDNFKYLRDDFGLNGKNAESFVLELLREIIIVDRVGVLVDYPKYENGKATITQAEKALNNIRPYCSIYKTESIINWREEVVNNKKQTTLVVLKEVEENYENDFYNPKFENTYRVLTLEPWMDEKINMPSQRYKVEIFKEVKNKKGEMIVESVSASYPTIKGKYLNYIPFYPITSRGLGWDINYSIVNDMCDVNLSHFRNSANKENGLIWTGNPTPYVSGLIDRENTTISLGSTEILELDVNGKAGYMEFTGQGLAPISDAMKEKEVMMATLGAKIVMPDKKMSETAEAALIHRAGEQGVLATIANGLSSAITRIAREIADIEGISYVEDTLYIQLNNDYVPTEISANDMIALMQMYQAGAISIEVMRWNLRKGERIPNSISDEEIEEQLKKNPPPLKDDGMNADIKDEGGDEESLNGKIPVKEEDGDKEEEDDKE